jgi:hypothetical protein
MAGGEAGGGKVVSGMLEEDPAAKVTEGWRLARWRAWAMK